MNYTKGEWRQSKVHPDTVWVEGREIAICYCYSPDSEANAHLIAAAPDMYEALKTIYGWVQTADVDHVKRKPSSALPVPDAVILEYQGRLGANFPWQLVIEAIAKAEGREP